MLRQSVLRAAWRFGSIKQFKLPDLGEKIKEAVVKQWHVKVGDQVDEVPNIKYPTTDKMFTQIPSSYKGKVHKLFHNIEENCQVGELFLEIEVEDAVSTPKSAAPPVQAPTQAPKQTEALDHARTEQQARSDGTWVLASPAVRRVAREQKIDLAKVVGSGKDGRILAEDLSKPTVIAAAVASAVVIHQSVTQQGFQTLKMSDFQKGMQKSMTESNTIPTLYLMEEYDITSLSEIREDLKRQLNLPITFMSLFIKAFSLALLKYPIINSTYDPETPFEFKQHSDHNISLAMDSPNGLVVPNIKNCQSLSIIEIHKELNRLRQLGEKGQLSQKELFNGTICISNIGTIGGTYTGPLILPPQVCIVGLGRVQTLPRYDQKMNVVPRKIMNVTFGCDHRVVDGATVTRFSNQWKQHLENPVQMLVQLK